MEKAKYKVLNIAHYVVDKCTNENNPISNLQLQKILYFLQRDYLKNYKQPLFEEKIEAWVFGPVVPLVYYEYCGYGALKIDKTYNDIEIEYDDKNFVDSIIEERREYNPWSLVSETHQEGSAWKRIYKNGEGNKQEISLDYMEKYA